MVNHTRKRVCTKTAKLYSLIYLVLLTIGSLGFLTFTLLGIYETRVSTVEVFRSFAVVIAGILAILGIAKEKLWAKWFTIAIYSVYIFLSIAGIVNSFSSEPAFNLVGANTLIALRFWRVIILLVSSVGIILLLKKPTSENN
ncbi:hypothetical protein NIES4101_60360 [Calothrix sp. NIES-4101]|nr:hypothetical protein NIES4101_60360 [Calothrix sp. NIES-4101]